jgi:pimeloyl-ACP methyl ester carboxylesterase
VVGRGHSDWLKDPMGYQVPNYAADMLALLAQLKPATLDWVGTSMGGLIGMVVCGQPGLPTPVQVRRLVLNDVGPVIQWQAIQRIGQYLGDTGRFDSVEQAADAAIHSGRTRARHAGAVASHAGRRHGRADCTTIPPSRPFAGVTSCPLPRN